MQASQLRGKQQEDTGQATGRGYLWQALFLCWAASAALVSALCSRVVRLGSAQLAVQSRVIPSFSSSALTSDRCILVA